MSLTSFRYAAFLFAAVLCWWVLPGKGRKPFLLAASYGFYALWQPLYALLLPAATVLSFFCALLCEKRRFGHCRLWTGLGVGLLFAVLFFCKYLHFLVNDLLGLSLSFTPLLPVGISFYTFSAAGYLFDVQRSKMKAERSFVDYALFLALFPSILSGPINRARDILPQLHDLPAFRFENIRAGFLRFTFGAAKKLALADLLGLLVDGVYGNVYDCGPFLVLCAAIAYSLQIYFDFSGYSDMALGSAQLLGLTLAENFDAPYLAGTVQGFWRRWHMSLTGWFREYLYFPLGGSRRGQLRTFLNILLVFAVSGMWHGAAVSFLTWGLLNGLYQVFAILWAPVGRRLRGGLRLRENHPVLLVVRGLWVFGLITAAWVLFRTGSLSESIFIGKRILLLLRDGMGPGSLGDYLTRRQLLTALGLTGFFTVEDILRLRGKSLTGILGSRCLAWPVMAVLWLLIALFGVYGAGYDAGSFVYFQF